MKVALIFPPYSHKVFSENLSTVDEEFCLAPPIILAYVAAILQRHGHDVMLLDIRTLNLTKEEALQKIKAFGPDMLAFRSETYHFHDALEWVGFLKNALGVPVITGGINLSLYPNETMSHDEIDYGVIGEAVDPLPRLIASLEESGRDIDKIPGIAYKKDGKVIINPPLDTCVDLDSYPFPARGLLPNDRYYSFISQLKNFTVMLTSVGCPYKCSFCAIHPYIKYRARSAKNVADEIEQCYKEFGVREIDFFDAVLFVNKARMFEMFNEIRRRNLKIEWSCRARVDVVDKDILREASKAGCRQIYYGIESVDTGILGGIRKEIEPQQVKDAIKWTRNYGIRAMGFFMVGNPGETKESVYRTIDFSKGLNLDFIQVCRTIAKPGTELDRIMIDKTGVDYWRQHVSGKLINHRLPTPWCDLSEADIEALTKKFYLKFYMRPRIILSRLFQLRSLAELFRYMKVGLKMFLQRSELYSRFRTDTQEAQRVLEESRMYDAEAARAAKVAVVIPTYNESGNIENIVRAINGVLPLANIVIVDDNSPDRTADIAGKLARENSRVHVILRAGKRGLGFAYVEGFKYVLDNLDSDFIFEMDADFSHNPRYLPVFLHYAREYDLVIGSRFLNKVSIKNRTLWRNVISKTTKWFMNVLTGINLADVTTGFKCFRRDLLKKIDLDRISSRGYAFQVEMSYAARSMGAKIKEIPILFIERTVGASKMSFFIMLEGVALIFRLSLRRFVSRK